MQKLEDEGQKLVRHWAAVEASVISGTLGGGGATYSLNEVLQTQLNGESGFADTAVAQHHNLVRRSEPRRHVGSDVLRGSNRSRGRDGGPVTAKDGADRPIVAGGRKSEMGKLF